MSPILKTFAAISALIATTSSVPALAQSGTCMKGEDFAKLPDHVRQLMASNGEIPKICSTGSTALLRSNSSGKNWQKHRLSPVIDYQRDRYTPYVDRSDFMDQSSYEEYVSKTNARTVVIINGMRY